MIGWGSASGRARTLPHTAHPAWRYPALASRRAALGIAALLLALAAPATVAAEPVVLPPAEATAAVAGPAVTPTAACVRYVPTTPPAPTLGLNASGFAAGALLTFKV